MLIKNVNNDEKNQILEFCKDTFSWGDYIDLVWDFWINEGRFLCIYDENTPVGVCHVSLSGESKQIWIEGIRIHPKFRRRCFATQLVLMSESIGLENSCDVSYMLIDGTNTHSLTLAENLNYKVNQVWNFYSIQNTQNVQDTNARFVTSIQEMSNPISQSLKFVKSWRWLPFNSFFINDLISNRHVIRVNSDSVQSIATIVPSEHFDNTVLVTIIHGNKSGICELVKFVQNYGLSNNVSRIQLLINKELAFENPSFEKSLVFNLMKKNLS